MPIIPNVKKMSKHAKKYAGNLYLAKIVYKKIINDTILVIRLKTDMVFSAGQQIQLYSIDGQSQHYYIASHQFFNDYIELYVDLNLGNAFSIWLQKKVYLYDSIEISSQQYFFNKKINHENILLCCDKQGISGLFGMLTDCIIHHSNKKIEVVISVDDKKDIYLLKRFIKYEKISYNISIHYVIKSQLMIDAFVFLKNKYKTFSKCNMIFFGENIFIKSMLQLSLDKGAKHTDISSYYS